ncbi:hypothetical protein JCM8097_003384 [Rhodosporidiobolus ruineniae]
MFAARTAAAATTRRLATRQASTLPHHPHSFHPPHYSLKERMEKFIPHESYPLIAFVIFMSSFGIYSGVHAINAVPGDLRLTPKRLQKAQEEKPWESERALSGKW